MVRGDLKKENLTMSRSKRDQKGRRVNGEIWGHDCYQVADGKVYSVAGGDLVGSPAAKKWAKTHVSRIRRRQERKLTDNHSY
jgi:hypothetical protein